MKLLQLFKNGHLFCSRLPNRVSISVACSRLSSRQVSSLPSPEQTPLRSLEAFPALKARYFAYKEFCRAKINESRLNANGVFPNNELDLSEIEIYGFDYDYTLAVYKESLDYLIYNLGRDVLVTKYKYPKDIYSLDYFPGFAIRGLHYDIEHGLLMKIDSFHQIQMGSVYRGFSAVEDEEVLDIYGGSYISQSLIRPDDYPKMKQLNDLFSVPEICLLANVTEYFERRNISYHPEILFYDVQKAVQSIHPVVHNMLDEYKIGDFLERQPALKDFLHNLHKANKKMFLITNSPYKFVNNGMNYMIGDHWKDLFDLIIVHARKPKFFVQYHRPFRCYNLEKDCHFWEQVTSFEKGKVYMEGTVKQMLAMTGWRGNSILYFGDQIYSDLADLTLYHGWRTGAVIKELEKEINTLNSEDFAEAISELQAVQELIDEEQAKCSAESTGDDEQSEILQCLLEDRDTLRKKTKTLFNPQFGSIFRTHHNPTYFSRRLFRYSDIYTSDITNLRDYSLKHLFVPRRGFLPHEKTGTRMSLTGRQVLS